jgi:hypothetical protein
MEETKAINVVIPCLNEEDYLGILLDSLTKQTFKNFDVTVVDGQSNDRTVEIAKSYYDKLDMKVVVCPKRGLGTQRSYGAKLGSADKILFLDADIILHPNFMQDLVDGLKNKDLDLVNCWLIPLSKKRVDKIMYNLYNIFFLEFSRYVWPVGIGNSLLVKREVFNRTGDFGDMVWEDVDFVKRAIALGAKYGVLRKPKVYASVRRFDMQGRMNYVRENFKILRYAIRNKKMPDQESGLYPLGIDYSKLDLKKTELNEAKLVRLSERFKNYLAKIKEKIENFDLKDFIEK